MYNKTNVYKRQLNIKGYIISILLSIFLGLMITLGVSLCVGYRYRVVTTDSMQPTITAGSLIIEGKTKFADIQVGDIITYTRTYESNVKYTHRVIDNVDGVLLVRGDNPDHEQIDQVTADNYVGRVVMVLPNIRLFFDWVYSNMFFLLYATVVIVVTYQIVGMY